MRSPKRRDIEQEIAGEVQRDFDSRMREGVRSIIDRVSAFVFFAGCTIEQRPLPGGHSFARRGLEFLRSNT